MLARDPEGGLHFPSPRARALPGLLDDWAEEPDAVQIIGSVLKLIRTLRTHHDAPRAAQTLGDALRQAPHAFSVVTRHWIGGRRPRFGADLMPVRAGLAPKHDAPPARGSVPLRSLVSPLQDRRGEHLQRKPGGKP